MHNIAGRNSTVAIENYELSTTLGKGSMGKVKLGTNMKTNEKVAIKIIKRMNKVSKYTPSGHPKTKEEMLEEKKRNEIREVRTLREAHIMMLLRHPHVVQLKNLFATGPSFYIIMDYVDGGQLLHYIVRRKKLSEHRSRRFSRQIVSALDYLHRNSIVHRDLKIENILIDKAGENIKIIDFGLSNLFCPERPLTTYCGSLYFAAPELLRGTPYHGPEIDVWSLGVVIYVMVTGSVPFDDKSLPGLHEKIKRGQVAYPAYLTDACRQLLAKIFLTDPKKRIILANIIRHDWMNEGYDKPIKSYLPIRLPIAPPLNHQILRHMTRGFNIGATEDIQAKMKVVVGSSVYRQNAEYVARVQHANVNLSLEEFLKQPYEDPQSFPSAYHPLLSIYHLTRERLSNQEVEQVPDIPADGIETPVSTPFPSRDEDDGDTSDLSYPRNVVALELPDEVKAPPSVYNVSITTTIDDDDEYSEDFIQLQETPESKIEEVQPKPKQSFIYSVANIFAKMICVR